MAIKGGIRTNGLPFVSTPRQAIRLTRRQPLAPFVSPYKPADNIEHKYVFSHGFGHPAGLLLYLLFPALSILGGHWPLDADWFIQSPVVLSNIFIE